MTGGDQWTVPANGIGTVINETATEINIRYEYTGVGATRYLIGWRYINATDTPLRVIKLAQFPLENIDKMRQAILSAAFTAPDVAFNVTAQNLEPYDLIKKENAEGDQRAIMGSQEGLGIATYQSDMLNNWLDKEIVDNINLQTQVSTAGGGFSIEALIMAEKMYDIMNRIAVSGGSYEDWQDAVYGMEKYSKPEIPVYIGGLSTELLFQEVISNSEAGGEAGQAQPLGTLAGRGVFNAERKGGNIRIKCDEACILLGTARLIPRIDYHEGNDWSFKLESMDDLHKPGLDGIGFQDSDNEQRAWWDAWQHPDGHWSTTSAGKVPAWLNYKTNVNRVRGSFAEKDNLDFMVLLRRYEAEAGGVWFTIGDVTTYIDPSKFNRIFAQTSLDSQNFWMNFGVGIEVRRVMSANEMPKL